MSREQLENDLDAWLMVSRALELAAQCCVDLTMVLVAHKGLGAPESYRDAFARLVQAGVISAGQSTGLQGWAGLRNVLVHIYSSIDLDRLNAVLTSDHSLLRDFGRVAARELGYRGEP